MPNDVRDLDVVLLHGLGGSARSWDGVVALRPAGLRLLSLDLPGHGAEAGDPRLSLDGLQAAVADALVPLGARPWLLVGHSMGGKVAALLTAAAERTADPVAPPAGVLLVDPSPPSPEPMAAQRRARMLGWWSDGPIGRADAEEYVDANCSSPLPADARDLAIQQVRRSAGDAWRAWLTGGSLEDRGAEVGRLRTPAVVLAGESDEDLGLDAQRRLVLPHWGDAVLEPVAGAAHFVPQERPDAVAEAIVRLRARAGV